MIILLNSIIISALLRIQSFLVILILNISKKKHKEEILRNCNVRTKYFSAKRCCTTLKYSRTTVKK